MLEIHIPMYVCIYIYIYIYTHTHTYSCMQSVMLRLACILRYDVYKSDRSYLEMNGEQVKIIGRIAAIVVSVTFVCVCVCVCVCVFVCVGVCVGVIYQQTNQSLHPHV